MRKILLVIAILILTVAISYCQTQPLKLTIKSDKKVYEIGVPDIIDVEIKNTSDRDIWIIGP